MDDRTVARSVALGRAGFGLLLLVAPRLLTRRTGSRQDPPTPYIWWLRAFGIRDAVLGTGTLLALADGEDAATTRWVQMGALADSTDAVTALVYGKDLDRTGRLATLAIAAPAAVLGWKTAVGLSASR